MMFGENGYFKELPFFSRMWLFVVFFLKGKIPNDHSEVILEYIEERLQKRSISAELCVYSISLAYFHWSFYEIVTFI